MKTYKSQLGIILSVALLAIAVSGALQGALRQPFEFLETTTNETIFSGGTFVGPALSLARTGTFNDRGVVEYIGFVQRGPGYATVLAFAFLLFGERVLAVFLVNIISLALALLFLLLISRRFLSGWWQYVPPLAFALFWEVSALAWVGNYEMFTLALATFSFLAFFWYKDTKNFWWLAAAVLSFSFWILERPIMLYFTPFVFSYMIFLQWSSLSRKQRVAHLCVGAVVVSTVIGLWSFRNHRVLDTWQLGSGGHILLRRSSQVDFSAREIFSMALSFSVGDFIGSKLYRHYPLDAEPKAWDPAIERRIDAARERKESLVELGRNMYKEAIANIRRKPFTFFFTGFLGLFRLNAPPHYNGQEITHLFVGSHENIPPAAKMGIIALVRGAWYAFLSVTIYAMIVHRNNWRAWGLPALIIIYYNGMHTFFTHAEVRYLLTVMPFYFLFFAEGLRLLCQRFFASTNTLTPTG